MLKRSLPFVLVLVASAALAGETTQVPLKVTEPVGVKRNAEPVTGGVPVEPLGVKSAKELVLLDEAGNAVPAQITPTVKLESGTLQWVLVEFLADLGPKATKNFTLRRRTGKEKAPAAPKYAVTFSQDDDGVTLSNGVLKVVLSKKKFDLLDMVWLDGDGDGKFTDAEKVLATEKPAALALLRGTDGAAFDSRSGKVEKVTLEDAGPVRTTVRVDGTFGKAGDGGESWLKYTARITIWAGRPEVRVLYAIRNVHPTVITQAHIKKATVTLRLAPPTGDRKHYLIGAGTVRMSQISSGGKDAYKGSQWHNTVELAQVGPPLPVCGKSHRRFYKLVNFKDAGYRVKQYQPGKRKPIVDIGFKSGGWVDLAGDSGGCLVWLRNFTQDCPKRLLAHVGGRVEVEVIPEYAGKDQPYYADGGYWLGDRSHRTYELNFTFHAKPLAGEADWKKYRGTYSNFVAPTPATGARATGIVQSARHRLQLVATPEWYTRTMSLWGVMPTLEEERAAAVRLGWKKAGPVKFNHVAALARDFLHYENFHYRSEWDEPRDAVVEFLRTGNWDVYVRAHTFARNYRDLGVWRTDGQSMGARAKGESPAKGAWAIPRWGKFCGCHHYGAGLLDIWLVSGDRSYLDAGLEWGYQCAVSKAYGGFGNRHWGRRMAAVLRAYQVTRDPKLKAFLIKHCRPPIPGEALRADGRALLAGKHLSSWMVGLCGHAVWHNYVEHRGECKGVELDDFEDGLIGIARNVANYWWNEKTQSGPYWFDFDGAGPGKIKFNGGSPPYSTTCIDMMTRGYLLTGDRHLLESARKYWNNVNGADATVQNARLQDFQGMGSNGFWARQLVYELAHPRKDAKAPAAVTDLKAEALGGGRVKLTWTAPKDEGGKAARYQVKHAPLPFCIMRDYKYPGDRGRKWTWWAGYNVAGEPAPGKAGAEQSMEVGGVPAGKRFFCVRTRDDSNNESGLGNIVEVKVK